MSFLAGYIPIVYPLNALQDWWYLLLIPLAFGISMIYKAMRLDRLDRLGRYWRQVIVMTIQIVLAMVALAVVLAIIIQMLIPMVPAR